MAAADNSAIHVNRPGLEAPVTRANMPNGARCAAGFLAVVAFPLLLLVDAGIALARGWEMTERLDRVIVWGMSAISLAASLLILLPAGRRFFGRSAAKLIVIVAGLVTCALVTEIALRVGFPGLNRAFHTQDPGKRAFRPDPKFIPGVSAETVLTTNSDGVRGPEMPARADAYRILCIGGSTTICTFLDDAKTWPALLMQQLNDALKPRRVWVGNAGSSGYSSAHHLKFVRESTLFGNVDCAVFLVGANDLLKRLEGRGLDQEQSLVDRSPLALRSRTAALIRRSWRIIMGTRDIWSEDFTGANYERRRAKRQAARVSESPPDLDAALREYADRLRAIVTVCRQQGVRPVFASQPVFWRADLNADENSLLWMGQLGNGEFLSAPRLREAIERYNETLRGVCAEVGVEFIDLSPLHGVRELYYDDAHYTDAGARAVAERIADWFREHPGGLLSQR